ncbi:MAG: hypothetical protein H6Q72_1684, partial [Firmicutes bacterium]|nr:hypothetical protein [Bacillota bacterium]
ELCIESLTFHVGHLLVLLYQPFLVSAKGITVHIDSVISVEEEQEGWKRWKPGFASQ